MINSVSRRVIWLPLFLILGHFVFGGCGKQNDTLDRLNERYLLAASNEEKQAIISDLEHYYQAYSIPDTILEAVEMEFADLIQATRDSSDAIFSSDYRNMTTEDLQSILLDMIRMALVGIVNEVPAESQKLLQAARPVAAKLDEEMDTECWSALVQQMGTFDSVEAAKWLKADIAEKLCAQYHDEIRSWQAAECYGAFALQCLQGQAKSRLVLNVWQRLQYILYMFYGAYDLSIGLAERNLVIADSCKYLLRRTGIAYHQADALVQKADYAEAVKVLRQVVEVADANEDLLYWHRQNARLLLCEAYWQDCRYELSESIAEDLAGMELSNNEKINYLIWRGKVNGYLGRIGNYEQSKSALDSALQIARKNDLKDNEIGVLHNIGFRYFELSEFDKAMDYFNQSLGLLDEFNPNNDERRIDLLIDMAKVEAKQKRLDSAFRLMEKARQILKEVQCPYNTLMHFHATFGRILQDSEQHEKAVHSFRLADSICSVRGLARLNLYNQPYFVESLIEVGDIREAQRRIASMKEAAIELQDDERLVWVNVLYAKIAGKSGDLIEAASQSLHTISQAEKIVAGMTDNIEKTAFLQKIYDVLKNASYSQLQLRHNALALLILDYAKARFLGKPSYFDYITEGSSAVSDSIVLELSRRMSPKTLLVNYMIAEDKVYALTITKTKGLKIIDLNLDYADLKRTTQNYKAKIDSTRLLFNDYDIKQAAAHFERVTQVGASLFRKLLPKAHFDLDRFDWLFIVPDEILHEIPFATLVCDDTTFVIDKVAVGILPSALALPEDSIFEPDKKRVLYSADPSFAEAEKFVRSLKKEFADLDELAISETDTNSIDVFKQIAANYDVILVLGHGEAYRRIPELSFIELFARVGDSEKKKKIVLSVGDLAGIVAARTQHVLLIGCETAGGKLYRNAGISSLQQSILGIGASSVLASLWEIDAPDAVPSAAHYLRLWTGGTNPVVALQRMQLDAIAKLKTDPYFGGLPHPYAWGGYRILTNTQVH